MGIHQSVAMSSLPLSVMAGTLLLLASLSVASRADLHGHNSDAPTSVSTLKSVTSGLAPRLGQIKFYRLWISGDGHTHLENCTVQNLTKHLLPGGKTPQYNRDLGASVPPT